ncbi:hypothetical protein [Rhizobium sp. OAE497]|jgi:hypothetical protein|uniref:hypothetical protein n=1 Tax=unclassified Rhizobium TaxID=2613769 RepID=UPI001A19F979
MAMAPISAIFSGIVGVGVMKSVVPDIVPEAFYWARPVKQTDGALSIVQISTVFGEAPDYWTVAVLGSEQHHMIEDFQLLAIIDPPDTTSLRQAAE